VRGSLYVRPRGAVSVAKAKRVMEERKSIALLAEQERTVTEEQRCSFLL